MSNIKILFFDNDGTLVDSEKIVFDCIQMVFKDMGIPYFLQDFQQTVQITNEGTRGFLDRQGKRDLYDAFKIKRDALWIPRLKFGGHVIPGVPETLTKLKKNYRMALTTSVRYPRFIDMTRDCDLLSYFEFGLFREDCQAIKPDPEIYLKALERSKVKANQALVIEDTPRGVMAAKNAGIRVVAIPNDMTKNLDFSMADFQLNSITELPGLLKTL